MRAIPRAFPDLQFAPAAKEDWPISPEGQALKVAPCLAARNATYQATLFPYAHVVALNSPFVINRDAENDPLAYPDPWYSGQLPYNRLPRVVPVAPWSLYEPFDFY